MVKNLKKAKKLRKEEEEVVEPAPSDDEAEDIDEEVDEDEEGSHHSMDEGSKAGTDGQDDDEDMEEEDEDEEETEKKNRKTAVLYFSSIPPKFTPNRLKGYFEKVAPGMIGRVFLARNKHAKTIENRFSEGWLEIKRKKLAKRIAESVHGTPVGGKKRDYVSSVLWNIKYLSGFKWYHLVEQLNYEKALETKRMQAEVGVARKIASIFEEQVEKGERLRRLEEKVLKQGGKWEQFQRQVNQKKVIKKNIKKKKEQDAGDEEVMKMIFS